VLTMTWSRSSEGKKNSASLLVYLGVYELWKFIANKV
jgi:hypothetical protein